MDSPVFADKSRAPTDVELASALGRAKQHWDALVACAGKMCPSVAVQWKYYTAKYGWTCVLRDKKRNLLYLRPGEKRFLASLALSEKAMGAIADPHLPQKLVAEIRKAPKYPEGRPVRVEVTSAKHLAIVRRLLAIKATS